jgi:hypothetical protein
MVETCSTMAWLQLNRDLLRLTGDGKFADEIEKTLHNALLGAHDPNGLDWAYFILPNGMRSHAHPWACCKSSGALALEEIAPLVFAIREGGVALNLYTDGEGRFDTPAGELALRVTTGYPRDEEVRISVTLPQEYTFPLFIRIPAWADGASVWVNGAAQAGVAPGGYAMIDRSWRDGDQVLVRLPMDLRVLRNASAVAQAGQQISRMDYMALARGPVSYATGLIDGYRQAATVRMPTTNPERSFEGCGTPPGLDGPAFRLRVPGHEPIVFLPYYQAGDRAPGTWRSSWLSVVWD